MKITKDLLSNVLFLYIIDNGRLVYCLQHYDECMKQLNDELDNCNYFGENGKTESTN